MVIVVIVNLVIKMYDGKIDILNCYMIMLIDGIKVFLDWVVMSIVNVYMVIDLMDVDMFKFGLSVGIYILVFLMVGIIKLVEVNSSVDIMVVNVVIGILIIK